MYKQESSPGLGTTDTERTLRHITCLIASPSDTAEERAVCEKIIAELNKSLGMKLGFLLETRMWENDTRPAIGEYPQAVINDQLGDDYDLFIGIMYQRFGTPTKMAGSGTEEEFNRAYERHKNGDGVEIMFYFNTSSFSMDTDLDELQRVKAFRQNVGSLGALYQTYSGSPEFEEKLRAHLTAQLVERYGGKRTEETTLKGGDNLQSIEQILQQRLDEALVSFAGQPVIWVDPVLSKTNDISPNPNTNFNNRVKLEELVESPTSTIVKAPPQFGLTCLAHRLVLDAWKKGSPWVYLDSRHIKAHHMDKAVEMAAMELGWKAEDVKCVVLDSWNFFDERAAKKLKTLCTSHPDIPVLVMFTIDDAKFRSAVEENERINRDFSVLHLLALPRTQLRKVVAHYNRVREIGDEDVVLAKVISDLHTLKGSSKNLSTTFSDTILTS